MTGRMQGQVALVTGAGSGIGLACTERFTREGATVAGIDLRGAVGYFGYDVVRFFERLPQTAAPALDLPDALFLLVDTVVVFDHARHRLILLANAHIEEGNADVEAAYVDALRRIDRLAEKLLRPLPAVPTRRWGATHGNGQEIEANMPRERYEEIRPDEAALEGVLAAGAEQAPATTPDQ